MALNERLPFCLVLAYWLLAACFADSQGDIAEFCGYAVGTVPPPAAEGFAEFLGELQHVPITEATMGYYRFGNPKAGRPPLVMVPAYGRTMGHWASTTLLELARHQEVIIFDNRGMGQSQDYSGRPFTVNDMAKDTWELVQGLKLGTKPNLLGLSVGGFVAITSAAFYGNYYDNIIVVSGSAGSPNSPQPSNQVQQQATDPKMTEIGLLNLTFPLQFPSGAQAACESYFEADLVGPPDFNRSTFYRQMGAIYNYFFWEDDTWGALPHVQNNVLLIAGENDILVPVKGAKDMAARLPSPWLSIFKEAGHGVMAQYRSDVLDLIDVFLTWADRLAEADARWEVHSSSP